MVGHVSICAFLLRARAELETRRGCVRRRSPTWKRGNPTDWNPWACRVGRPAGGQKRQTGFGEPQSAGFRVAIRAFGPYHGGVSG
ncbi:hypothetical protein B7486_09940 [cyanobacterium TDX16]|nr:hypothetical protein B7486_09940 [cyanobacterium TDX16]